jgi:hypothetical protein
MNTIYLGTKTACECIVKDIWGLIDVVFLTFLITMLFLMIYCIFDDLRKKE